MSIDQTPKQSELTLESWKEIGAYLQRDSTTVRRWEREEGLPVHRHSHKRRSSVYAYPSEIDAWRVSRKVVAEAVAEPPGLRWRRPLALAATMLLCLMLIGSGLRPQAASAEARQITRQLWAGAEALGSVRGSPSPDGRYLTFLDQGGLSVRDLREGRSRRLTKDSTGYLWYSVFSPDSRQVAYGWVTGKDSYDLRILPLAGAEATQPRIVHRSEDTAGIRPFAWTPDGKQLLVLRTLKDRTNQIALVSVRDGSVRVLKSIAWPNAQPATLSLSPDGTFIAYDAPAGDNASGAKDIFVLAADGSQEKVVVQHPADDYLPMWSPNGGRILFLSDRTGNPSLWSVPIQGGAPRGPAALVKADVGRIRPWMTRSGALYYLISGGFRSNVYFAELDAAMKMSNAPVLASERFIGSNSAPTWSPDGQYLAYLSSRLPGANGSSSTVLVIRTLKTGEERDVPMSLKLITGNLVPSPKWFPDGRSVLVWSINGNTAVYYRVDPASGNAELLHSPKGVYGAGGLGANAISPGGKTIFYIAAVDESTLADRKLVRFEIDSGRETVLKAGQIFMSLALSPDGAQLATARNDEQGCHLEVRPGGGGETREVFHSPGANCGNPNALAWSRDQRYLLFVRGGPSRSSVLWRIPVAGGDPEQTGISMSGQLMYPELHADGRRITFGRFETGASEVWALENFLGR